MDPSLRRSPGEGRYARTEREQRWLLAALPADAAELATIVDRYLDGTQLRLRRMTTDAGLVVLKLAQKVRLVPADPETVRTTNVYLTPEEHQALSALPAAELRKTRYRATVDGHRVAVDRFEGPLAGLVLAEVELDRSDERLPLLTGFVRDVTGDDRYAGGSLARTAEDEVRDLLAPTPADAR